MRDIKFRYYSHKSKEMRSWDDLQKLHVHTVFKMMQPECKLMQFTGLKDKNGVEIYEGDIVIVNESHKALKADFGENKRVVQWRMGGACLDMLHADYLESKRKIGLMFDNGSVDDVKVIGNIYENPELLKTPN